MLRSRSLKAEAWSEPSDDVLDALVENAEVVEKDRVRSIAQSYIEGSIVLHLHLRVRPAWGYSDAKEFCWVIAGGLGAEAEAMHFGYATDGYRPPSDEIRDRLDLLIGEGQRGPFGDGAIGTDQKVGGNAGGANSDATGVEKAVFVCVIQPGQAGEWVTVTTCFGPQL
jgi:hypothetical protein